MTAEPPAGSCDSKVHKDPADSSVDAAAASADKSEQLDVAITIDEAPQGAISHEKGGAGASTGAAPMSASNGNTGSTLPFDQL